MKYKLIFMLILILSLTTIVWPQKKITKRTNIAVLDFEARGGVDNNEAASLSDIFTGELISTQQFVVIERNRIKSILQEQGFQQSEACSQVSCIVEVGKILKVQRMFAGTIGKIGKMYTVAIQLIDIETGEIVSNKTREHKGDIEELTDILKGMADEITSEITGSKIEISRGGSTTWLWYVGGAAVAGTATYFILQKRTSTNSTENQLPKMPALP